MEFHNQVVLVTGGGTGIGKEVARRFLGEGAKVVINGRRQQVLSETAQELDPSGERIAISRGDIGEVETAQRLVKTAVERFGGVDILINNAGIFKPTPFLEHTESDFDRYINIILKGTFFSSQIAIAEMVKRGKGAIVNVGSMWANQAIGATPSSAYSAAKAGVHALTRNLAIEFATHDIRVNTVAPAVVETPVYGTFMSPEEVQQVLPSFNSFHPLGRNGQPTDVVEAIIYLASDRASWITGAVLPVDGGVTAGRQAA
ncbi:SDR family NAD(P)-dependent oxidoreductase [Calothrix rhizosoleniae]|uniref:SDR family NAD(P)-dependent oxidoreductase n=1 Tax=Calothrix rhizosoleniae TaxID=888997 RepID=UPI000B49FFE3|nr:SDR family NAD(P)-dependent oxidoreductase [Calothrix rhizosoleniae]